LRRELFFSLSSKLTVGAEVVAVVVEVVVEAEEEEDGA
jgi:hypothetical protein